MFSTEHLEGRMVYETNKIACINVYAQPTYDPNRTFLVQLLVSLINYKYINSSVPVSFGPSALSREDINKEIKEGVEQYHKNRMFLELY